MDAKCGLLKKRESKMDMKKDSFIQSWKTTAYGGGNVLTGYAYK